VLKSVFDTSKASAACRATVCAITISTRIECLISDPFFPLALSPRVIQFLHSPDALFPKLRTVFCDSIGTVKDGMVKQRSQQWILFIEAYKAQLKSFGALVDDPVLESLADHCSETLESLSLQIGHVFTSDESLERVCSFKELRKLEVGLCGWNEASALIQMPRLEHLQEFSLSLLSRILFQWRETISFVASLPSTVSFIEPHLN
jgi:hypothetical protein